MSSGSTLLAVSPERCQQCGRCVRACPGGHVRVGGGYIYVDTAACDGCLKCVAACDRGAIQSRAVPKRPSATRALGTPEVPKVVVGSRAEAKALRKAAANAEKQQATALKAQARQARADHANVTRQTLTASDGTAAWTTLDAVIAVAVIGLTVLVERVVLRSQAVSLMPAQGQYIARLLLLLALFGCRLGALAYLAHRHGTSLVRAFGLGRLNRDWSHRAVSAGLVIVGLVVTRAASTVWGGAAQAAGWMPPATAQITEVFGLGVGGIALAFALVMFAGPFVEELAFRGVVLSAAGERMGMWPAITVTAALFAASHATAWVFVPVFILGMVSGWLAWTRCSLWPSIALHALYNGVVLAAVLLRAGVIGGV